MAPSTKLTWQLDAPLTAPPTASPRPVASPFCCHAVHLSRCVLPLPPCQCCWPGRDPANWWL